MISKYNFYKQDRQFKCLVRFNSGMTLTEEKIISIDYEFNQDTEKIIGATIGRMVTIKVKRDVYENIAENDDENYDGPKNGDPRYDQQWDDNIDEIKIGIRNDKTIDNGDGTTSIVENYDWVNLGDNWIVDSVNEKKFTVELTALEPMSTKFNETYTDVGFNGYTTIGLLMKHIEDKFGVSYKIGGMGCSFKHKFLDKNGGGQ